MPRREKYFLTFVWWIDPEENGRRSAKVWHAPYVWTFRSVACHIFFGAGPKEVGEMGREAFLRSGEVNRAVILQPIENKRTMSIFQGG
jgi:hypothetical protein